jgi:hypothetical protein
LLSFAYLRTLSNQFTPTSNGSLILLEHLQQETFRSELRWPALQVRPGLGSFLGNGTFSAQVRKVPGNLGQLVALIINDFPGYVWRRGIIQFGEQIWRKKEKAGS